VVFLSAVVGWEIDTKLKARAAASEKEILILKVGLTLSERRFTFGSSHSKNPPEEGTTMKPRCCPCTESHDPAGNSFTRRDFLKGAGVAALGSVAAGGLAWPLLAGRVETADEVFRLVHALAFTAARRYVIK